MGRSLEKIEPVAAFFNTEKDPLELKSLAADRELDTPKVKAVPYHDYPRYGTLYDRNLAWDKKQPVCTKPKQKEK